MAYIIVTVRSVLWLLLTLTAVMALIAGIITPKWLVGYRRNPYINSTKDAFSPTIGLYNRCSRVSMYINRKPWSCGPYIDSLADMPSDFWKASFVFLVAGSAIFGICVLFALVGFCIQNLGKKSLYSVVGLIQGISGKFKNFSNYTLILLRILMPSVVFNRPTTTETSILQD